MKKPIRKYGYFVIPFFLGLLIFGILYVLILQVFVIRNIEVIGQNIQIKSNTDKFPRYLLFFKTDTIKQEILENNPLILSLSVKKKYPDTIVLDVTSRIPVLRLITPYQKLLLDTEGYVLGEAVSHQYLPLMKHDHQQVSFGQKLQDEYVLQALQCIKLLDDRYFIDSISVDDTGLLHVFIEGIDVIISSKEDLTLKVSPLQILITGFRIKGTLPTEIDLRFSKPIIRM